MPLFSVYGVHKNVILYVLYKINTIHAYITHYFFYFNGKELFRTDTTIPKIFHFV